MPDESRSALERAIAWLRIGTSPMDDLVTPAGERERRLHEAADPLPPVAER